MPKLNIAIVEPNSLFREGLRQLLQDPPFVVSAVMRRASERFGTEDVDLPELLIWGPGSDDDIESELAWMRTRCGDSGRTRFVLLTGVDDVAAIRRAAAAGADAILPQDIPVDVLKCALHLVALGQQLFPSALGHPAHSSVPGLSADLLPFPKTRRERPPRMGVEPQREVVLSRRESQVLHFLVDGAPNKAIAQELRITEAAVKAHVKWVLKKVGASNRTQAAIWALNNKVRIMGVPDEPTPIGAAAGRPALTISEPIRPV